VSEIAGLGGRLFSSRNLLWTVLALPGLYWCQGYWRETLFYGEVVHATGVLATQLMIVTMAISPLQRVLPRFGWLLWLRRRRRNLGVAAFGYSFLHAAVYFERQESLARIVNDAREVAMTTGWLGIFLMLILAITSNDSSMRLLKGRWQQLHRLVYIAAALTFAHWILSAFDPVTGYVYLGILAALESLRLFKRSAR
jgi:methionine sulfoxide reductase heme-binding subunit